MIRTPFDTPPAEGAAITVAPGILWLRLPLPMKLDHVNVYALEDGDGWTLIDTGMDSRRTRAIWDALRAGPLQGRPIRRVIGTHHHPDHIGLAGWFMAEGATLAMSRTAWLMARMLVLDEQDRPSPEALAFWRRAGMPPELMDRRASERPFNFADTVHPLPPGYTRLTEGQVLAIGPRRWRVAMGHGHAPCHVTLWSLDDHLVIGGDQLLPSISPNLGVYPTEPEADPVGEWLESCTRLAALAQGDQLVLPGHKLPFTGLPMRLNQLIQNHHSALERLTQALHEAPRTAVGCFDILYRRQIGDGEFGLALVEAVAHLNHLARADVIRPVGETDGAVLWGA
ncbi:MAG: MBL fold metallo-hydrolase [Paracoccus sp. (in: a-proteobacteria)]|uniref:MBL fold metallo-hydrolase n=1 Tax=Paracoccus sp. TaxID=267 RepID=UPI00391D9878